MFAKQTPGFQHEVLELPHLENYITQSLNKIKGYRDISQKKMETKTEKKAAKLKTFKLITKLYTSKYK